MIIGAALLKALRLDGPPPPDAQAVCEQAFCTALANATGHDLADVASLYGLLSDNLQDLVHSPQGWAALGRIMVADAGFLVQLASVH